MFTGRTEKMPKSKKPTIADAMIADQQSRLQMLKQTVQTGGTIDDYIMKCLERQPLLKEAIEEERKQALELLYSAFGAGIKEIPMPKITLKPLTTLTKKTRGPYKKRAPEPVASSRVKRAKRGVYEALIFTAVDQLNTPYTSLDICAKLGETSARVKNHIYKMYRAGKLPGLKLLPKSSENFRRQEVIEEAN
jgi:hypothetical protein